MKLIPITIGLIFAATAHGAKVERAPANSTAEQKVEYYMGRLIDKDYWEPYGCDGSEVHFYVAAEELGKIGMPAIPPLIAKLDTSDVFEKTLTLYALRLATQVPDLMKMTGGKYIETEGAFPYGDRELVTNVQIAKQWWKTYKHLWNEDRPPGDSAVDSKGKTKSEQEAPEQPLPSPTQK